MALGDKRQTEVSLTISAKCHSQLQLGVADDSVDKFALWRPSIKIHPVFAPKPSCEILFEILLAIELNFPTTMKSASHAYCQ